MTDYCKASIAVTYSENADYTDADWEIDDSSWDPYEILPTEQWGPSKVLVATAGTTLTPSGFQSTSAMLLFKNLDTSNYVQVGWTDVSTTACVARVPAGGILVVPAINPATAVVATANGAACSCKVAFVQTA